MDDLRDPWSYVLGYTRGTGFLISRIDNALRPISHHEDNTHREPFHRLGEMLACLCWCGQSTVRVTPQDVFNGRTGSCEEWDCRPDYERYARVRENLRRRGKLRGGRHFEGIYNYEPPHYEVAS